MIKSQPMEMDVDLPDSPSRSASPEKKSRDRRGRSRETKSVGVAKSVPTIRKNSRSPVKRSTLVDAIDDLQISRSGKPAK